MRPFLFGGLMAAFMATAAEAQTFCRFDPVTLCNGCEVTFNWYVVASTVPRPVPTGEKSAPDFCSMTFEGIGTYTKPIEIIRKPTLGEAKVAGVHHVLYRSKKVGQDTLTFVLHKNSGLNGQPYQTTVTLKVHVLDKPM